MTDTFATLQRVLAERYRLERELGQGGMATVYLAEDVRHRRHVAIKVLHAELSAVLGSERFLKEIELTANLQHPHILPLFDSGSAEGLLFYVMPYVEGETLRARLERETQLPVAEAVRLAAEVADALDYAHRRGVVHRDIKPENILLQDGRVLVADFGIALAVQSAGGQRMTQTGLSLGTPHYMAPEQAMGDKSVDQRADIYALGAVTYEMLAGEPPFTGPNPQAIVARLLTTAPEPLSAKRPSTPAAVEAAVMGALAKLPADRFGSAKEFAEAMGGRGSGAMAAATAGAMHAATTAGSVRHRGAWRTHAAWGAALLVVAALGAWGATRAPEAVPATPVRFAIPVRGVTNFGNSLSIAISRDGRTTVFAANSPTGRQLHVRTLGETEIRVLEGTQDAWAASISPDGRSVAFLVAGGLRRIPIEGGPVSSVYDAPGLLDVSWLDDETIIAQRELGFDDTGLLAVPASGGAPRSITRVDSSMKELLQHRPRVVLGGTKILYVSVAGSGLSNTQLAIADVKTGKLHELGLTGVMGIGFIDDQLIYVREDGSIMAAPMDMRALRVRGAGIVLAPSVFVQPGFAAAALSEQGTLVYVQASSASRLILAEAGGGIRNLLDEPRRYAHPRFSPDGSRLVVDVVGRPTLDIWSLDLKAGTFQRVTTDGNNDRPSWSPDGTRIAFLSDRESRDGMFLAWSIAADGSGAPERLFDWPNPVREVVYTPDGSALLFREDHPAQRRNVLRRALGAGAKAEPLLTSPFDELMPRVSPDGRWLAYVSDESGRREVYLRAFPGGGGKVQVSEGGAAEPLWSPNGSALYYRSGDRLVRALLGANGASLAVTGREVVLEGSYEANIYHPNWDVSPDGRRFVLLKPADEGSQLVTVVHFDAELRQRIGRR